MQEARMFAVNGTDTFKYAIYSKTCYAKSAPKLYAKDNLIIRPPTMGLTSPTSIHVDKKEAKMSVSKADLPCVWVSWCFCHNESI
jgi:hypothetical protein